MKQGTATILRCIILALSIIPAAWLILSATDAAVLFFRERFHVENAQGARITCHYIHATGTYEVTDFTTDPDAVTCAMFVSLRSPPPVTEGRWAAPLPNDRTVQLECRFIRWPAEGDDGLGERFTAEAPLRLAVNFSTGQLDLVSADDRSALGEPKKLPPNPNNLYVQFEHGAAPIFAGDKTHVVVLSIHSHDGRAWMFLARPLLWSREGGCRPSA